MKRQTQALCYPTSRSLCNHTFATSRFYDHCIEQLFPCDTEGFAMKYAKKRAELLEKELQVSPELKTYLEKTELCFQKNFRALVESKSKVYPNDETCLELETEAVSILNNCYRQPELCSLLSDNEDIYDQIHSVVKAFRIGADYHNDTLVNMGLPNAILESCSNHTELAKSLTSSELPVRVILCAASYDRRNGGGSAFNGAGYIEKLSQVMNRSSDQFTYFGKDADTYWCSTVNPIHAQSQVLDYFVIAWFASPSDPLLSRAYNHLFSEERKSYMIDEGIYFLQFHETREERREPSQCGDGIRQIGEDCDPKSNIESGCLRNCTVHRDYTCNTDALSPSVCQLREAPRLERVPCPAPIRRRSKTTHSRLTVSFNNTYLEDTLPIEDAQFLSASSADSSLRTLNVPLLILIALIGLCWS